MPSGSERRFLVPDPIGDLAIQARKPKGRLSISSWEVSVLGQDPTTRDNYHLGVAHTSTGRPP